MPLLETHGTSEFGLRDPTQTTSSPRRWCRLRRWPARVGELLDGAGVWGNTPEQQAQEMAKWEAWFDGLGAALVDPGLPVPLPRR
jgi:hypothetical protein